MAAEATYASTAFSTADASSYTFSSQGIGTASADRLVVVSLHARAAGSVTLNAVTIGGNSATIVVSHTNSSGGNSTITALAVLLVASGTTANIVATFSATALRCSIGVWAVTGAEATPEATHTTAAGGADNNISVDADRCVISAVSDSFGAGSFTWSELTENYDTSGEGFCTSGALSNLSASDASLNLRSNHSNGVSIRSQVAAVFEPAATATSNGSYYRYLLGN